MSTYYVRHRRDLKGLLPWLKSRWWIDTEENAYKFFGFTVGVYKILEEIWDSDFWLNRVAKVWTYNYTRSKISRSFIEVFEKNGEIFVDKVVIEIPEKTWRGRCQEEGPNR